MTIELRDVSDQDAPSQVLSRQILTDVPVGPGMRLPFDFQGPTATAGRALSLRVQVDMHPGRVHAPGDLLSTQSYAVPATGDVLGVTIPLTKL